nr:hypothetical protein [Kibdelosporangium sp. MJ126-NF4]CTQ93896.1 hypothetical protein [Kibdelosporangium sp. MJ126-NF4]
MAGTAKASRHATTRVLGVEVRSRRQIGTRALSVAARAEISQG